MYLFEMLVQAFFGGYGSLCASLVALLPLSLSAAAISVLLPVFIMLACGDISPVDRVITGEVSQ